LRAPLVAELSITITLAFRFYRISAAAWVDQANNHGTRQSKSHRLLNCPVRHNCKVTLLASKAFIQVAHYGIALFSQTQS